MQLNALQKVSLEVKLTIQFNKHFKLNIENTQEIWNRKLEFTAQYYKINRLKF